MITVTPVSPTRVDIDISGRIDAKDMKDGLTALLDTSEGITGGTMLYTITDLSLPTPGALAVEFGMLPRLFSLISRFDHIAVLTDLGWVRTAAEIEGRLLPGLTIKAFELTEKDSAETWLAEAASA